MEEMIRAAVESGAHSLLIKAGDVFRARVDGQLVKLSETPFTPEDTRRIALELLPEGMEERELDELGDHDFAWEIPDLARFRVNLLRQRGTHMVVMRVIPWRVPHFEELGLPPVLEELADLEDGLVLVTGATGSGKSTTQAAMMGWINRHRKKHIITLEDPIEYRHPNRRGTVTQREVGKDVASFRVGLRSALRQDPDVILIGEMRDRETIEIALEAAETGQLVVSTFHAATAIGTLGHFVAMFGEEDEIVRKRISESLRAVISQKLVGRRDGEGRVPAVEILRVTAAVRESIQRDEPPSEIRRLMEEGEDQYGMQTFDRHLMRLVRNGTVAYETAKAVAVSPADFELVMQTLAGEDATRSAGPGGGAGGSDRGDEAGGEEVPPPPEGFAPGEDRFR